MSKATVLYTDQNGERGFALLDRITHVEGGENCRIHLDTGEVIQTQDDLTHLRAQVEVAYQLREREGQKWESQSSHSTPSCGAK